MTHHTITRTHNGGPDLVVHTKPVDLALEPEPRRPDWTDPPPVREPASIDNPWSARLPGGAVLLVALVAVGVLLCL